MDIFKVIGIGILGAIVALMLKNTQSSYAILAVIATGIVILIIAVNALGQVIVAFEEIVDKTNLSSALFATLLKIIGIGYLTEYSVNLCNDMECASIGKKISFAGKITIFLMAMPIVTALIKTVAGLVG
ncbi:MAG: hypothetical protein K2M44_01670 [Clostridia bacterium]|nr:hypothetical protein [Clostridia bacterium]